MEFKTATIEDLQKFVADKRGELKNLRFSAQGSKTRNVKSAREMRKEIARALTELSARANANA